MKKFLSIILAALMSLTLFVGCKSTPDDNTGGGTGDGGNQPTNNPSFSFYVLQNKQVTPLNDLSVYVNGDSTLYCLTTGSTSISSGSVKNITWSVSNDSIVKLDYSTNNVAKLKVIGKAQGTATLKATDTDGNYRELNVTVKDPSIQVSKDTFNMFVDEGNSTLDLAPYFTIIDNLPITYSSSNSAIVSVNGSVLTAYKKGSVTITAKNTSANVTETVTVNVYDEPIVVEKHFTLIYNDTVKESIDFNVISKYSDFNYLYSVNNVAVIENGKLVAKGLGSTQITIKDISNTDSVTINVEVVETRSSSVALTSLENKYVNLYGRNYFVANKGVQFENTVSGFEFKFYGTAAYAEIYGVPAGEYMSRFQVLVDGEKADRTEVDLYGNNTEKSKTSTNGQTILNINSATKTKYTLVEGLQVGWHTVKVLKRTAARRGGTTMDKAILASVSTNEGGYIGVKPEKPELKIEVYGDSISCCYGNLYNGDNMHNNTTNGLLGYHYIAAEKLNAEINVQAHSGWGILYDTSGNQSWLWPAYYNKYENMSTAYDMSFDADFIIINLGTNDTSGINKNSNFINDFAAATVAWVKKLYVHNPDAKVILTYGMMGQNYNIVTGYNKAVTDLKAEGYNNVYYYQYNSSYYDGSGHPGRDNHINNGDALATYINTLLR